MARVAAHGNTNLQHTPGVIMKKPLLLTALSRHGIRAPLVGYGSALAEATPHT